MIALLPIRGWTGDVMASQALGERIAAATAAAAQPAPVEAAHDECHGHAATPAPADTQAASQPQGAANDCGNCSSCQVCHSVVMAVSLVPTVLHAAHHAQPLQTGVPFASAEPLRGIKPPIS